MVARGIGKKARPALQGVAAKAGPVSEFTLAAIPWMSHRKLAGLAQRVARYGPSTPSHWKKIVSRADVILPSFLPWDICLLLNAKAHASYRDSSFLSRLCKTAIGKIEDMTPTDVAMAANALAMLDWQESDIFYSLADRFTATSSTFDARQVGMIAQAFCRRQIVAPVFLETLVSEAVRVSGDILPRELGGLFHAVVSLNDICQHDTNILESENFEKLLMKLPATISEMDDQSVLLVLNGVSRANVGNKDLLDLLFDKVLEKARAPQVASACAALGKLKPLPPKLQDAVLVGLRRSTKYLDAQGVVHAATAIARLQLKDQVLLTGMRSVAVPQFRLFDARQLASYAVSLSRIYCPVPYYHLQLAHDE